MSEENKGVARRYVQQFWNEGRVDLFEEIVAQDAVAHTNQGDADYEGWKQGAGMLRKAFPDFHITVEDEMSADSKVVQRWTLSGTNQGDYLGISATGKKVVWSAIAIFRLSGAKIAEVWVQGDNLSMMQQLGVVPSPGG